MFLPKKSKIFESLAIQAEMLEKAALVFKNLTEDFARLKDLAQALELLENNADKQVHVINEEIQKFFILPMDKEDIKELSEGLDDIIDNLEQVSNRLKIYQIPHTHEALQKFAELLYEAALEIHRSVLLIRDHKLESAEFVAAFKNLHTLENEGDKLHREVLEKLLGQNSSEFDSDPLSVLKWKEIFQTLEDTLDICEDLAILLERLRIKYL